MRTGLSKDLIARVLGGAPKYTIAELEENLAVTELTMIENYEAQEEINAQTENALIEIYEMMEG